MKRVSIIFFLLLVRPVAECQTTTHKSGQVSAAAILDTNRVNRLNDLAEANQFTNADTAILLAQQAFSLADSLHYRSGMAFADLLLNGAYATLGNYRVALYYCFKCKDLAKDLPEPHLYIRCCAHLMITYSDMGEFDKALSYAREEAGLVQKNYPNRLYFAYMQISRSFVGEHHADSAIYYAKKALRQYGHQAGRPIAPNTFVGPDPISYILSTLGLAYLDKGEYDSALVYFRRGIPKAVSGNIGVDLIDICNGMSTLFIKTGHLDSAAWYCKKVLSEKTGKTYPAGLLAAEETLFRVYRSESKIDSAFKYLEAATNLKDSLFDAQKTIAAKNLAFSEQENEKEMAASRLEYQNQLKIFSLAGGFVIVLAILLILYRHNRQRRRAYAILKEQQAETIRQKAKTEQALSDLRSAQSQLVQSEKMASLGALTAGIAHEIQNPLNFVNNFSDVNRELLTDLIAAFKAGHTDEANAIAGDIINNEEKINHHGKRADAIVKAMLQHSRTGTGQKDPTDINALCDEYLRLAYHGLRAKEKGFQVKFETDFDPAIGKINIVAHDMGRAILNLINNAFFAVHEKARLQIEGYDPKVVVTTRSVVFPPGGQKGVEIIVKDNGSGIPPNIVDKIFHPFFTTKPAGSGTGLGLSLSYDIVKVHGGDIVLETREGQGSQFTIQIPGV